MVNLTFWPKLFVQREGKFWKDTKGLTFLFGQKSLVEKEAKF